MLKRSRVPGVNPDALAGGEVDRAHLARDLQERMARAGDALQDEPVATEEPGAELLDHLHIELYAILTREERVALAEDALAGREVDVQHLAWETADKRHAPGLATRREVV